MKKTYMTPDIQVVEVELRLLDQASQMVVNGDKPVNANNATLLGRGSGDWDDED